jgi:broad specificity phosphatase PhoE
MSDISRHLPDHAYPIFLVRHGETTWNREWRMQGHRDAPLTDLGATQAAMVGRTLRDLLADVPPATLVMSPLGRARRSAELICEGAGHRIDVIRIDQRLKEISWGVFEGMTRDEIRTAAPDFWADRKTDRWSSAPPGGESYAQLSLRLAPVLAELMGLRQPVVVVAHGGVRRALRGLYGALPPVEVIALEEPHDVIVRLHAGTMTSFVANLEDIS